MVGNNTLIQRALRIALVVSGLILALPVGELVGYTNTKLNVAAFVIGLPAIVLCWVINRGVPVATRATA
jgi:uncharacterized membrane protein (Fun14 family)